MPFLAFFYLERDKTMNQIKMDDFLNFRYISNLTENPSRSQFAYTVAKADVKKNEYTHEFFICDGQKHQKKLKLKNKASFVFESDQSILYIYTKNKQEEKSVKEDKKTIYYRYHLLSSKTEKAYEFPMPCSIHKVLDQNTLLISATLTSEQHHLYLKNTEERKSYIKELKKQALYEEIKEIPFYFNGQGFVANQRNQLFLYDIEKQSFKPLVDPDFSIGIIRLSEDKKHIYYTGQQMTGIRSMTTHVFVYHVDSNQTDILYHENDCSINQLYLLGNEVIIAGKDMKDFGINQNPDFYLLKNKKLEVLTLYGGSLGNTVGADVRLGANPTDGIHSDKIYFLSTVDDHVELCSIDRHGLIKMEFQFNGAIDGFVVINNTFYAVGLYRQKLHEIYHLDLANNKANQITRMNQLVLKNKYVALPKTVYVRYNTHVVKGFVLYPKDFKSTKKYPLILNIHGGPKTVYGKVYYHEMQYWANQGYFVCFCNPRGSDGKGNHFADIRGQYGTIDYQDIMSFMNEVIKKTPEIDESKLFVTGGSYGGFMTNWIIGHTDRFKAAVTQRSITNWLSFHGTSDIGFYFSKDQTAGHPIDNTEKLWQASPIKYVENIKTPLLIIHSDQDYRCPIEQAMQLFTILKEKGVDTKFVWFKGENHELSRSGKPQARLKRLNEITSWFDTHQS